MKLLRIILTIYFSALLIMPCSDVKAQSVKAYGASPVSKVTEDTHSDKKDDSCSPFCFCSCCQITVTTFKITPVPEIPLKFQIYFSKKILFHKNNVAGQVYDHIWQPPKI